MSGPEAHPRPSLAASLRLLAIADLAVIRRNRLGEQILAAVRGGASAIQLRGKECTGGEFLAAADEVARMLRDWQVPLFVNDRADVAVLAGARGVHLGAEDLPVPAARQVLGPDLWIGSTARRPADAARAVAEGADYLGVGSVFGSGTKPGLPVIGTEGLRAVAAASAVPVVAIGGIDAARAADCVAAGAAGVAAIGGIFAGDPTPAEVTARARAYRAAVAHGLEARRADSGAADDGDEGREGRGR
jgi:thiamine-phosphate diphosphorylase